MKAEIAIFVSDKANFKAIKMVRDKKRALHNEKEVNSPKGNNH
jgi:hypothetical protein